MIKINNFSKKDIYKNFNLEINEGITFLKGRNGSGKTILLDAISNVDNNYTGIITGNDDIVYLNQNIYISGMLKVEDFVKFTVNLNGNRYSKEKFMEIVESYKDIFNFSEMIDKKIGKLSGGELRFTFFITLIAMSKKWYILDEPFNFVDIENKQIMCKLIKKIVNDGKNVIITSHDEIFLEYLNNVNIIDIDEIKKKIV